MNYIFTAALASLMKLDEFPLKKAPAAFELVVDVLQSQLNFLTLKFTVQ